MFVLTYWLFFALILSKVFLQNAVKVSEVNEILIKLMPTTKPYQSYSNKEL